ncbi:FecCD family ABC transporter permease [Paenibacillus alkalitolerans]|uniref:FecCD family ABC transporter permease n=1 Tax=Paenibacillus alkalitolerans TaxID=2799335 RepID=UPI002D7EB2E3|nr:iron ABC transporter permease [Paenibacillus alkalitolerans]
MKKQYYPFRLKSLRISALLHKKTVSVTLMLAVASIAALVASAGLGDMAISPPDVVKTIFGKGAEEHDIVINTLRLPRIVVAFLVGVSLAVSGAILQGVIRNPLASPDVIGITAGASVAAVAFISYLSGQVSIHWLPLAATLGAWAISLIIYVLAWKQGVTPVRLVLIGIGVDLLIDALTTIMLVTSPMYKTSQSYIWLTGTVYGSSWENVLTILPWTIVLIPFALIYARNVNVQQLGDDIAQGVGSSVQRHRFILLFISVALAGSAVAVAGGVAFVGLIAPHMARKMVGPVFGGVLPVSALIGGLTVLLADLAARTLFMPHDIPVGVLTSAVGAPFFIYLLYRNRNSK